MVCVPLPEMPKAAQLSSGGRNVMEGRRTGLSDGDLVLVLGHMGELRWSDIGALINGWPSRRGGVTAEVS